MHKCIPCEGYFIVPCERHPGVEVLFVLVIHPGLNNSPVVALQFKHKIEVKSKLEGN